MLHNAMSNKDLLAELKTKIGAHIPPHPHPAPAPAPKEKPTAARKPREGKRGTPKPAAAEPTPRSGRGVQFYLDDLDRKIIHNLAVWFASQDRRVSDSQVIKAAIRMAEVHQGSKLLELGDQVRSTDRRRQLRTSRA